MFKPNSNQLADLVLDRFFLQNIEDAHQKFPPFNIGRSKLDENKYILQLAVAGFTADDIVVTLEKNILTISSTTDAVNDHSSSEWLFYINGIAKRKFIRRFTLFNNDPTEITKATFNDGVLSIFIERIISERDKPRNIPIQTTDNAKLLS